MGNLLNFEDGIKKNSKKNAKKKDKNNILDLKDDEKVYEMSRGLYPTFDLEPTSFYPCSINLMPERHDIRLLVTKEGRLLPVEVSDLGVIRQVGEEELLRLVSFYMDFCQKFWPPEARFAHDKKDIENAISYWKLNSKQESDIFRDAVILEENVYPVLFKSQPGLTWKRLDFDPDIRCHPGLWEDFLERFENLEGVSNAEAFLAWIGSVLDPDSNREQYIWLQGEGSTGKSRIVHALMQCFGDAATSERCPNKHSDNKFLLSGLENKRFVNISEADSDFVQSNLFKSLTGDDFHKIENKWEKPYTKKIFCKFFITSNDVPVVPPKIEHIRRIILCELGELKTPAMRQVDVDKNLAYGLPWLFARALEEYDKVRHLASIPCDTSVVEEYSGMIGEEAQLLFAKHFVQMPGGWVSSADIYQRLGMDGLKGNEARKIIRRWESLKIISPKRKAKGGPRGYQGLGAIGCCGQKYDF